MNEDNRSTIVKKLFGKSKTIQVAHENVDTSSLRSPQLRPRPSQSTIYTAGASISCLDRSSDGKRVVIAGAKVFKILRVDGSTITEELDLRAIITSYAATHDPSAATPDQLNIRAVKWSHGDLANLIVTASGNGRITVYDLNRVASGLELGRIYEHNRQVHKLAISPHLCNWLLSASQDGTVKHFDLKKMMPGRTASSAPTFRVGNTFKCNAEAVRDVKWSPTDGMEFACCTDTGVVQKWDITRPGAPALKLKAHASSCLSISWHPDGEHLVSGGIDQTCHVWDLSKKADRNQKPRYTFATPGPVSRVSWRPAYWSVTAGGRRAAQVTVSYDDSNPSKNQVSAVHIWDLARPAMPFKEIEQWDTAPTDMLWNSRDILWCTDKEGRFTQTDAAFVPKLLDCRSLSTFAFSPTGEVLMMLEERQPPRRARPMITSAEVSPAFHHKRNEPLLSFSRSDSEEDVVGSFLGPRPKSHKRPHSGRSQMMSTTPPTATGMVESNMLSLDDAVKVTGTYKPQQIMAIGQAPSTAKQAMYKYFSRRYLERIARVNPNEPPDERASAIMYSYGRVAENFGHYRLAQTWRLLGYTTGLLLKRRAEYHRKLRLAVKEAPLEDQQQKDTSPAPKSHSDFGDDTPRRPVRGSRPGTPLHRAPVSMIAEEIESTSNVATPLVRPVRDHIAHQTREAMHTPLAVENDELRLPDAAHPSTPDPIPVPGTRISPGEPSSSVEGYDFYGMESFSPVIDFAAPQRKQPLRLDYHENATPSRIQPQRHDSGESFQMFSTSGDSQSKFMSASDSDTHGSHPDNTLRERVSNWENSQSTGMRHRPSIDSEGPEFSGSSQSHPTPDSVEINRGIRTHLPHNPSSPPVFRIQEASTPLDTDRTPSRPTHSQEPVSPKTSEIVQPVLEDVNPELIASDYLPRPTDPDFLIHPMSPTVLTQRTIDFEVQTSSLHAAAMVLLLRPILPSDAIDAIQGSAIIRTFHARLNNFKLFTEAALLRNLCVPDYPAVFSSAQEKVSTAFYCTSCRKPLDNDPLIHDSEWTCPRCREGIAPCVICNSRTLDPEIEHEFSFPLSSTNKLGTWFFCPGCGHGGHGFCMQVWHSGHEGEEGDLSSEGACPVEGCLHPCLSGKWRGEFQDEKRIVQEKEMANLVRENARRGIGAGRGVRRDGREVGQSKAVEGVRVALGGMGGGSGGLERKKSVKVVLPGEGA